MQAISAALERLTDDGRWFARDHAQRLLVVRASGDVRAPALELLPKLEYHADNFSPWFVLEDGWSADDDGWLARAVRLADLWDQRWAQSFKQGLELGTVPPPSIPTALMAAEQKRASLLDRLMRRRPAPTGPAPERLEVFARTVADVTRALRDPLRGLVLVLAPSAVESPEIFEAELELLLRARELRSCRLIVVLDDDASGLPRLRASMGDAAALCDCRLDPRQLEADLAALLAGFAAKADGTGGGGGASPPGVTPPPRVDDPPELPKDQRDAMLRQAGVEPALLDQGPRLRTLVLGAAMAMKQGRGTEAVRLQREVRDLCGQLGLLEAQVICHVALASYLSGLGHQEMAVEELEAAARFAESQELFAAQSQALLALGLVQFVAKKRPEAASAYAFAARVSEKAEAPMLAIEAYRMAGHLAEELRAQPQAITCYEEALRVAEETDAELVAASSASEVARLLAALKRKKAEAAEKAALGQQALALEQGMIGLGGGLRTEYTLEEMDLDAPIAPPSPRHAAGPPEPEPAEPSAPQQSDPDRPLDRELLEELTKKTLTLQEPSPAGRLGPPPLLSGRAVFVPPVPGAETPINQQQPSPPTTSDRGPAPYEHTMVLDEDQPAQATARAHNLQPFAKTMFLDSTEGLPRRAPSDTAADAPRGDGGDEEG